MIEPKKCDIWISQGNPCKITCHTCNKTFAELSMPMTTDVLKSVCDAYEKRCEMTLEELAQDPSTGAPDAL
jgi:hypothetical protein